ncbi:hypothetical protein DDB_G0285469 [Dictyostelium discoideum AX4]|uniref:Uncharacterized protein DDB_G0285469 n=1 Tax=Dictyostelium discoideum TaxID=44689 RepID=Y6515_DICDI|nr:hypothetical protein DDB_G0285469 [Dictyostelium discoideum AX4]Q54N70.1 RecName: Full=Uncharacterized protein DDB_G0285469 [Dictyostelium discoideum]EAL64572.1 hypothetical protein DDB_G0285469 [Dictyostelium discoideum AX4]|eukprot:XP_638073.1 hypothetical protein DDB_G0285469 [Dictyostelium discoideum AX4]
MTIINSLQSFLNFKKTNNINCSSSLYIDCKNNNIGYSNNNNNNKIYGTNFIAGFDIWIIDNGKTFEPNAGLKL